MGWATMAWYSAKSAGTGSQNSAATGHDSMAASTVAAASRQSAAPLALAAARPSGLVRCGQELGEQVSCTSGQQTTLALPEMFQNTTIRVITMIC